MNQSQENTAADLLIREVDEDLRHDQMVALWKKYGILIAAGAVVIVLGVAGWEAWQSWQSRLRLASSDRFAAAMGLVEAGKRDEALKDLAALAADGTQGYRLLARLERAEVLVASGDIKGALTQYQDIANDSGVDQIYRDTVTLKAAYLGLDGNDPAITDRMVAPLAKPNSPWRFAAEEVQALTALKRGETTRAIDLYKGLADDLGASPGIRARAAEMLKTLQPKTGG